MELLIAIRYLKLEFLIHHYQVSKAEISFSYKFVRLQEDIRQKYIVNLGKFRAYEYLSWVKVNKSCIESCTLLNMTIGIQKNFF